MVVNNLALLEKTLIAGLPPDRRPTELEVMALASTLRQAFPVPDDEFAALIKQVHSRLAITMDLGTFLSESSYAPWLAARKAEIDPFYWERYRLWLGRLGWAPLVINTVDGVSDELLDLEGDPRRDAPWSRRGLVVGDVQSGKTATYTALTCKAADAGYRLIILLTGTLESLRRQTQERLDEGFVGLDSSEMLQQAQIRTNRAVGVGVIDQRRSAGVFTSRSRDFSKQLMTQLGFRLDAFQVPVLVVLKKNKRILENLESWLRGYNAGPDGKIAAPVLLIDDEADSASINTNDPNSDPTAINERLRAMLALFSRSSYIGFTATPFANVFIEPETEHDMLGDDLFPRDYIYALEAPSNYVGPTRVFSDDPQMVRHNDDMEPYLPQSHKIGHPVDSLPPSLIEALRSFLLATTIRDLRGEGPTHRSMLVNVSRFTSVQDRVAQLLDLELRDIQRDIRNFSHLSPDEALKVATLAGLRDSWLREHDNTGFDWHEVQAALHESVQPITVKSVNQRTGAASLDYKANKEQGLRVVAVGGNSLSRGLTLEGLSTSYFFRNSQMYDTLLQMGRWFGYRDGYADLCRVWLSEEALHWYGHITEASEELRGEFKRMRRLELTPKDFGLKVRAHPDSLIVTARNKMRSAQTIVRQISLNAQGIETARLRSNPTVVEFNERHASAFLDRLSAEGILQSTSEWDNAIWRDVPKTLVADFLREFQTHPMNYQFQGEQLASFLRRTDEPRLQVWDVVLPKGAAEPRVTIGGVSLKPSLRRLVLRADNNSLLVSGSRARVGSRGIEREGLTLEQYEAVLTNHSDGNVSDVEFRRVRTKPLLLIHVVKGYVRTGDDKTQDEDFLPDGPLLVALGLSFPIFDDSEIAGRVEYKVNAVEWRSLVGSEEDDDPPSDDDID
jgi:hypothetical protein